MARKFMEERREQYQIEKAIELYVNEKGSLKEISEITNGTHDNGNSHKEEYTTQDGRRGVW